MESVKEVFESLPGRVPPEKAAGVTNSYLFEDRDAGIRRAAVNDGKVDVTEGEADADVRIGMSEETFRKLVDGKQNPATGVLTGKIKVSGDMAAATKLKTLLG